MQKGINQVALTVLRFIRTLLALLSWHDDGNVFIGTGIFALSKKAKQIMKKWDEKPRHLAKRKEECEEQNKRTIKS